MELIQTTSGILTGSTARPKLDIQEIDLGWGVMQLPDSQEIALGWGVMQLP